MAVITNAGLTLLATALQTPGGNAAIAYVDIAPGCGPLNAPLTSGTVYTSLSLGAALPANLANGQALTLTDGTHTQTVTVNGTPTAGATSIPVNSFTANANYAAVTTGVAPTPQATDAALYNAAAAVRVAATTGSAGANPGESLNSAYFDGTQASAVYMTVGYFAGAGATSTPGTGTLMAEDIQYWNHTLNADSATLQLDSTI